MAFLIAVAFSLQADDELAALRSRLQSVEESVAKLSRVLPPDRPGEETRTQISKRAARAGLELHMGDFSKPERLVLADGRPAPIEVTRLDLSARAEMGAVALFLETLSYSAQPVSVESLRMVSDGPDAVRFSARVAIAHYAEQPDEPVAARIHDVKAAIRSRLADQQLLLDLILKLTQAPTGQVVVRPLAVFTEAVGENAVGLTSVSFDRGFSIEGIAVGGAARAAVMAALATAHLKATSVEMGKTGVCRRFAVTAKLEEPEAKTLEDLVPEFKAIGGNGLFVSPSSAQCERERGAASKPVVVRGSQTDGLVLKYRNGDLADLFNVLAEVSGASFIVAADVAGRITIDVENATLDQTLEALRRNQVFVGPPPLRLVTRAPAATAVAQQKYSGEPISLLFRDADLRDYLCLFSRITGLKIQLASGIDGKVTIYSRDVEWDRALDVALQTRGLKYEFQNGDLFVTPRQQRDKAPEFTNACEGGPSFSDVRLKLLKMSQLDASDVELTALARVAGKWQGYASAPKGGLLIVEPGLELLDGRIEGVDATGVTVLRGDGTRRHIPITQAVE